jgi:SAM-dependent methyltransferase
MFEGIRWEKAPGEVEAVLHLAAVSAGSAVLELACGPGRHALEFGRRGFRVIGVDRRAPLLREARERAAREGLRVEWVRADMRRLRRSEAFDLAANLSTSFGYFEEADNDGGVAEDAFGSLRLGGAFVIELMGKEVWARLLTDSGFASVEVFGSLQGDPYDHTARQLVAVARQGQRDAGPSPCE